MTILAAALVLAFPALVLVAAAKDATSYTIPNWISGALLALFPLAALASGLPLPEMAVHGGVGLLMLLLGMAAFAFRLVGGGDAKLLAACSLWLGWPGTLTLVLVTCLAGGALALILLTLRSAPVRPLVLLGPPWITRLAEPGEGAPYAVAIAVGALAALPQTGFLAALAAL